MDSVFYYQNGMCDLNLSATAAAGGGGGDIRSKSIIDAGGYIGDSAIVFAQYTDKKVYSFEPSKHNFKMMLETIKLNNLQNKIVPINKALGDKNENMVIATEYGAVTTVEYQTDKNKDSQTVEATMLDKFVEDNDIEVGLIRTDVEGFEQNLLRGASETIKKQKPILLISIYHNAQDFFEIKPMIESWNLGYKFKIRKYAAFLVLTDTMLICEAN
jgi:FkbM family methyltransferase